MEIFTIICHILNYTGAYSYSADIMDKPKGLSQAYIVHALAPPIYEFVQSDLYVNYYD